MTVIFTVSAVCAIIPTEPAGATVLLRVSCIVYSISEPVRDQVLQHLQDNCQSRPLTSGTAGADNCERVLRKASMITHDSLAYRRGVFIASAASLWLQPRSGRDRHLLIVIKRSVHVG